MCSDSKNNFALPRGVTKAANNPGQAETNQWRGKGKSKLKMYVKWSYGDFL